MSKATDYADLAVSEARAGTDPTRCLAVAIAGLTYAIAEQPPPRKRTAPRKSTERYKGTQSRGPQ